MPSTLKLSRSGAASMDGTHTEGSHEVVVWVGIFDRAAGHGRRSSPTPGAPFAMPDHKQHCNVANILST